MRALSLPDSIYDIDVEWLNAAVNAGGHNVQVTAAERVDVIHATCTKARYRLEYDREAGLPTRMILKGAFEDHSERMKDMYQWEARFYAEVAPHIGLNVPRAFWSGIDPGGWRAATLMEDLTLRDVRFCRAQIPFDYAHLQLRLDQLAGLHAQTWQSPDIMPGGKWGWAASRFDDFSLGYYESYLRPEVWSEYMELPRGVAVAASLRDRDWMGHALHQLAKLEEADPLCMIHGDTHPGNLYHDADGTPGFLDATVSRACWWLEISYHLVASIDIADRRKWEQPLLVHYLAALEKAGGPRIEFGFAWLRYRQAIAHGLFIFLINETRFQTEATNTVYTARFGIAAVDHDTAALLSPRGHLRPGGG